MTTRAAATSARPAPIPEEVDEDLDADGLPEDDFDAIDAEAADSLSEETGIDLTDASEYADAHGIFALVASTRWWPRRRVLRLART